MQPDRRSSTAYAEWLRPEHPSGSVLLKTLALTFERTCKSIRECDIRGLSMVTDSEGGLSRFATERVYESNRLVSRRNLHFLPRLSTAVHSIPL